MRKLALLTAGGALWLFVAALPAFADGGIHVAATNNGTAGLDADSCAGCHRAHTATAAYLLNDDQPKLCLDCHDGSKSVVDVVDGVQYSGNGNTGPILGPLRGGGFKYALIDSGNAARITSANPPNSRQFGHVQPLATNASEKVTSTHGGTGGILNPGWGTGTVWGNGTTGSGVGANVDLECTSCHNPHGNNQYRILQTTPTFAATSINSGTWTKSAFAVQVADTTTTGTHNYTIRPATDGWNANGSAANLTASTSGDYWRYHWDPTGTLSWTLLSGGPGADPMNSGWNGASAVSSSAPGYAASTTLTAAILAADPTVPVASVAGFPTTFPFNIMIGSEELQVTAASGTTLTVTRGFNGTAAANAASGTAVTYVPATAALGNAIAAKAKCLQASNLSNQFPVAPFFVAIDSEIFQVSSTTASSTCAYWSVVAAQGGTTAAAHAFAATITLKAFTDRGTNGAPLTNADGLMTAWCIQCHTRYNGIQDASGNPSSLSDANAFSDVNFDYKHGTTRIGCEQCHVSHGSNAVMDGTNSLGYTDPSKITTPATVANVGPGNAVATSGDSRLLKVDNRGTCQLCHDPTQTLTLGTYLGPLPTPGN